MLMDRIIGAFTFRKGVYAEVEKDETFTQTAWTIVAVVAFLNQLGTRANAGGGLIGWIVSAVVGTIFAIIGFALAAWVISWVGKSLFQADTNFGEMVRVLGLAYVWNIIGLIGILAIISTTLVCVLTPVILISGLLGLVAWAVAAKEALDLDWGKTIVTLILGFIVNVIILWLAGIVLGLFGFAAHQLGGSLSS
jgi:hypothetical protein